ncbi:Type I restriction-modification system, DNA-methyltransferase subunit M / Type I restriction-modification system, specificity subunit S [hydrothermal vent metagenome]|uniref:Type I restriction-modification system, DNA-methyltransferase subunit M / Type I restriction-modification system, specificity subunit S n=1 Tax=hydrothermal vent metagenome TaxID=652676 RepID=A0A1W1EJT4_9ZZZZ
MITKDNFKNVLEKLGFENNSNIYTKTFNEFKTKLKVDFKNEKLIYPEADGLKVNDKTTSNFTSAENFVVFESVCKLLNQGYNPKHIELEPKWQVGHGASGGKADILIKDNDNKTLLIIECKTAGREFKKAWDSTKIKPTQLFSYAQQDRDTKFIALYTSDFVDNQIKSSYYLISLSDDEKMLFENKSLKSYRDANTVENIYNVWSETYRKEFKTNGIFEENKAYFIGLEKTNINDLKIVSSNDIKGKYNEFATIMRQHNIGGAERAFNVLVNLFLCKIIDEHRNIKNDKSGLDFYWKGIAYDDAFSLQDRLQELYKEGMFDFLKEEITYISDKAIDDMFKIVDLDSLKIDVKSKFREQKFFTNNDFSFLDVHSQELFYKNFEVLLKVVEMFQDIRLTGVEDNQFLGDMFEGFLDNGVKQSEGQFFTPMPIVKFIINSLPLKEIEKTHKAPKAIDFACGAGHFLNEVAKIFTSNEVVGIEKEYRLSKIAKVSALMYGQENINIVYNDALKQNKEIEDNSFSVLVANPPYSVKGFLETLNKDDIERYEELAKTIETKSYIANNSIECFFIERAKQILKANGVVGIVLPSSILSKGDGENSYVATREILIKYFEIIAIAEFGSGTFGKTGTNTVTLFLRRRDDNINIVGKYRDFVNNLFNHNKNIENLFKYKYMLEDYCTHIDIKPEIYLSMFESKLNQELFEHETFAEYRAEFEKSTESKNRKKRTNYKKLTKEKKEKIEAVELLKYIKNIEADKLYYFCLASDRKEVLIVKAPSNSKDNKKFLGYEWSGRKGNEGIQYSGGTLNTIITPLYNPNDSSDESKISTLISKNFTNENIVVPKELEEFVSMARLIDMIDFSRRDFNKAIGLSPKKEMKVIGKPEWQVKLGDVVDIKIGGTPSRSNNEYFNGNNLWVSISEMNGNVITDTKEYLSINGIKKSNVKLIPKGTTLLSFKLSIGKTAIAGKDLYTNEAIAGLIPKNNQIRNDYLFQLFNGRIIDLEKDNFNTFGKSLNSTFLKSEVKIPLPPLNIQKQIVKECELIDDEVEKANKEIETNQIKIEKYYQEIESKAKIPYRLSDSNNFDVFIGRRVVQKDIDEQKSGLPIYSANVFEIFGYTTKEFIKDFNSPSVLWGIDGDWMVNYIEKDKPFHPTDHCGVIRVKTDKINPKYLTWALLQEGKKINFSRTHRASTARVKALTIKAPSRQIQDTLIDEIKKLEIDISKSQKIIDEASEKKQAVLKRYL